MAAKHEGRFFGLDSQDSLRVSRWLTLHEEDRVTFYASFVNWACGLAHRLQTAPRAVPEDEADVIESLRDWPMRPQVLMRNLGWYLNRKYRRDMNKPHEGPIKIADGNNADVEIRAGETCLYGLLFPRGTDDKQYAGAKYVADLRSSKKAAKRARKLGRRAERRAAAAESSGSVISPTVALAYRPRDIVQDQSENNEHSQSEDNHDDKDASEELAKDITILAHRPKGSDRLLGPLTTQTPQL